MSSPWIFSESKPHAWRMAAVFALSLAIPALSISPEFSCACLALSLFAGLISFFVSKKLPRGSLAAWGVALSGIWLSPLANLEPDGQRWVFALGAIYVSLVFQGKPAVYFAAWIAAFGACARGLGLGFEAASLAELLETRSVQGLEFSAVLSAVVIFVRVSHTRATGLLQRLSMTSNHIEKIRSRVTTTQEGLQLTREALLGRVLAQGETSDGEFTALAGAELASRELLEMHTVELREMIKATRKTFADFQARGRASGRISGAIRFVFFPPVTGYDEEAVIAVDLPALLNGLETCLELALESLPEVGTRRREGVIRLSIRCGLRVIEVAVEDNGRGLATPLVHIDEGLNALKDLVPKWGGRLDRLIRLGVGSRTALELRIVRERARVAGRRTINTSYVGDPGGVPS